jgi:hypothetical protein
MLETRKVKRSLTDIKALMPDDIRQAHTHSSQHRNEILTSRMCGCFYCFEVFTPKVIKKWIDDYTTALCPYCGIDSVIGDKSGYPVDATFLNEMHQHWF